MRKKLKNFGSPVQYSAFEANLKPKEYDNMLKIIMSTIDEGEDKVRIYPLCDGCKQRTRILGDGKLTEDELTVFI